MIERINLSDLVIWSGNPRHGSLTQEDNLTENQIINILIESVGWSKMYNLCADILNKGLQGNKQPAIVRQPCRRGAADLNLVYDGNRRVSCCKILINPDIIENENHKRIIRELVRNRNITSLQVISCYICRNEQEAFDIMDREHAGQNRGIGTVPWAAYERDLANDRNGRAIMYSLGLNICKILEVKTKTDMKNKLGTIQYTDIDRLFSKQSLKDLFDITDIAEENIDHITGAINALNNYKTAEGFNSFSRQFNDDAGFAAFGTWYNHTDTATRDNPIAIVGRARRLPLIAWQNAAVRVTYDVGVGETIDEINKLKFTDYKNVVCSVIRSIVERTYNVIANRGAAVVGFVAAADNAGLRGKVESIINCLSTNHALIRNNDITVFPNQYEIRDWCRTFDNAKYLAFCADLNLQAHRGATNVVLSDVENRIRADISSLIVFVEYLLR